ncbi:RNA polymerase II mediator complex subunit [Saxophila tyrrhenica]|uniref:Mediator of RNA polymerase II transcription subunit 12 n=1 Tax=Saxophila tyrrhenica TaxID=1690608 RepID=A0AAV9NWN4_9PEZI|nr:RNA polymerase II mediator complex subunit [Saxophila tyrrhenica]
MERRAPQDVTRRPSAPQRAPVDVVDLTAERGRQEKRNGVDFMGRSDAMVTSPDVISIEDDEAEPPAKRTKTSGDGFRPIHEEAIGTTMDVDAADEVMPGSPLPSLPKTKIAAKRAHHQQRLVEPAARKSHGLEAPAVATRVPQPKKVLDFYPWTGNHPEDVLTENVIKNGYFDSAKNTNNSESNSARASVWPNISQKNHQSLSMLSLLFSTVLEKRQHLGKCTAPSTFKPPPRVTVTDTKREAWLRDLANPDVPLRKQSRTIPHGIRGKLLMEQCLSKAIPLQRAVWLAKCVGANELRAFRRKGVSGANAASGEAKWVREWTVQVEQFLEFVISTCGQKDWKQRMDYAVKLATAFFVEKLLDADHYLDWIVSSMAGATLERLPIWLLMVQLYWKAITAYSKRGKALAEGILEHLHGITNSGLETNSMLKTRLQKLVAVLAVSNRGCLIIPRTWSKYKDLLSPATSMASSTRSPANDITRRNERLATPWNSLESSPLLKLYAELDHVRLEVSIEGLATKCEAIVSDTNVLVAALLDLSSTPYRTGTARIYLAAGIIAYLNANGHDTDAAILAFLGSATTTPTTSSGNVHRVVVDLIRQERFSVGRYLQWLISSGVVSAGDQYGCATGLLSALPTSSLPLHLQNTRKTLMNRLKLRLDNEETIERAIRDFGQSIADFEAHGTITSPSVEALTVSGKISAVNTALERLRANVKDGGLSLCAFLVTRQLVERCGDLASLGELVSMTLTSDNTALLATSLDTTNLNAESFAAQGRLSTLFDAFVEQYMTLRSSQPLDRYFILALTAMAQRMPGKAALLKLLADDLAICEQQTSLAVCSPASDNLIGMQATSLEFDSDIDAVFASGNTMDDQLMQRVFMRIMDHATKSDLPTSEPVSKVGGWLSQLRSVDGSGVFDRIVQGYVRSALKGAREGALPVGAIDSLLASGSISPITVADMAKETATPRLAASILRIALSRDVSDNGLSECERYRLLLLKDRFQEEHASSLNALFRLAADSAKLDTEDSNLLDFVVKRSSTEPGSVRAFFDNDNLTDGAWCNAGRTVTAILKLDTESLLPSGKMDLRSLMSIAGPLSINYCVEAIRWMRSNGSWDQEDDETLQTAMMELFGTQSEVLPQLLQVASEKVNLAMHEWAQGQVLSMADHDNIESEDRLPSCLELLAVTNRATSKNDGTASVDSIAAKLKELVAQLSDLDIFAQEGMATLERCKYRLQLLLHLCVMHVHTISDESDMSKQARQNLLVALCILLVHPALQLQQDLIEYLFDLASALSDNLFDEPAASLRLAGLTKLPIDPRLTFILGSDSSAKDSWLALATPVHTPGLQPQRMLSRQSSGHLQPPTSGGASNAGQQVQQGPGQMHPQHQRFPSQGGMRMPPEVKVTPFALRRWEIMPDPTPVQGENDASLSLGLFAARKI